MVVPHEWRQQVLRENHCEPWNGHLGIEKTHDAIKKDYYWPGMYHDTQDFVKSCMECQRYKSRQTGPQGLMETRSLENPWKVVSADLMEFPRSNKGFTHLLVFQDLFTKWVELKPLRAANGPNIIRVLEDLIIFRWSAPDYMLVDNGKEFDYKSFHNAMSEYDIKQIIFYHIALRPTQWSE